jgi:hypothetical protein
MTLGSIPRTVGKRKEREDHIKKKWNDGDEDEEQKSVKLTTNLVNQ